MRYMGILKRIPMASLTIHSSSIVLPSHPTPNGILPLSDCDQMMAWTHFPIIYIYKPSDASPVTFDSLKHSLSQVLVPFYPLAGRLHWLNGDRLELDCCAVGAQFIEASTNTKLEDYGDFAPTDALRQLAPKVNYSNPIEELPVLLVQVTRFQCGGLGIGLAISHILTDATSAIMFINSWASIARGEQTSEGIVKPYHGRDLLQPQKPLDPPCFHHQEYEKPPLLIGRSDAEEESKKESVVASLNLTKDQVEKLKARANKENSKPVDQSMEMIGDELHPRPYSRYESIAGHIWKCACKARSTGQSCQPTVILIAVDIRRRLIPPLPEGFFGNAILLTVPPICEFGDLITKPVSYAAKKIREGTWKCRDKYLKSQLNFLASQEKIGWIRPSYESIEGSEPLYWGNPNLELGGWMMLPLYDADFGWGRPCYVGPAALNAEGESYIMPGPIGDGSLIIVIRLQTKHMDDFKKFFYEGL